MSPDKFRRIALSMKGAIEGTHMGHPDFRSNGRIFATIYPDGHSGMVKLTPAQQQEFMSADSVKFAPASGAWGRKGCTTVRFDSIDEDTLGHAITLAWQNTMKDQPTSPSKTRRSTKATERPRR